MCCFLSEPCRRGYYFVCVGTGLVPFEADGRRVGEGSKVVVVKTTVVTDLAARSKRRTALGGLRDPFLSEAVKCPLPYPIRGVGFLWFSVDV